MSTISRVNRPGPRRRCLPCPACGEDAMRQYGAKHHGVVSRYFYACQSCQHTDVWREIQDCTPYFERLREPLVPPRPEQCRLELPKTTPRTHERQAQSPETVNNIFSASCKENLSSIAIKPATQDMPRTCSTCARYFPEDELCHVSEELLQAMHLALGIAVRATELPINAKAVTDCSDWVDAAQSDRFRLLRRGQVLSRNVPL